MTVQTEENLAGYKVRDMKNWNEWCEVWKYTHLLVEI